MAVSETMQVCWCPLVGTSQGAQPPATREANGACIDGGVGNDAGLQVSAGRYFAGGAAPGDKTGRPLAGAARSLARRTGDYLLALILKNAALPEIGTLSVMSSSAAVEVAVPSPVAAVAAPGPTPFH